MTNDETKYLFIDTNIALHYRRIDEIVWREVTGNSSNTILVAPVVLKELDEKKHRAKTAKLKKRANEYVNWLWSISDNPESREIRSDATIDFLPNEPTVDFSAHNLNDAVGDDRLLASVLSYQNAKSTKTTIITSDIGLKIKARSHNIEVISLPDKFKLSEEPDAVERENQNLKKELAEYKNRKPHLSLYATEVDILKWEEPATFPEDNIVRITTPFIVSEEEYTNTGMKYERAKWPHLNLVNKQDSERLNNYFYQYKKYLKEKYKAVVNEGQCYTIAVKICNEATHLATNIDAAISFPGHIKVYDKWEKTAGPVEPKPPDKPHFIGFLENARGLLNNFSRNQIPDIAPIPMPNPGKGGPTWRTKNDIWYWCDDLKHGFCTKFRNFYVVLPYNQDLNNFHATCSLSCNELPNPQEQKLIFSFNTTD